VVTSRSSKNVIPGDSFDLWIVKRMVLALCTQLTLGLRVQLKKPELSSGAPDSAGYRAHCAVFFMV
jgi:hypothetical protein